MTSPALGTSCPGQPPNSHACTTCTPNPTGSVHHAGQWNEEPRSFRSLRSTPLVAAPAGCRLRWCSGPQSGETGPASMSAEEEWRSVALMLLLDWVEQMHAPLRLAYVRGLVWSWLLPLDFGAPSVHLAEKHTAVLRFLRHNLHHDRTTEIPVTCASARSGTVENIRGRSSTCRLVAVVCAFCHLGTTAEATTCRYRPLHTDAQCNSGAGMSPVVSPYSFCHRMSQFTQSRQGIYITAKQSYHSHWRSVRSVASLLLSAEQLLDSQMQTSTAMGKHDWKQQYAVSLLSV